MSVADCVFASSTMPTIRFDFVKPRAQFCARPKRHPFHPWLRPGEAHIAHGPGACHMDSGHGTSRLVPDVTRTTQPDAGDWPASGTRYIDFCARDVNCDGREGAQP